MVILSSFTLPACLRPQPTAYLQDQARLGCTSRRMHDLIHESAHARLSADVSSVESSRQAEAAQWLLIRPNR